MAGSKPASSSGLQRAWNRRSGLALLLLPVSWLYGALVQARAWRYRVGWARTYRAPVPVIVVGNVVAGGAGKTPVTIAVIEHLQQTGWTPALVSRGYGRSSKGLALSAPDQREPLDSAIFGDEPALIARRCGVPVAVAQRRSDAARALLNGHPQIDILVCDDGLQHLALERDIDICVWGAAGSGNGWLLPAGPLREPWPRPVDLVLHAADTPPASAAPAFRMRRSLARFAVTASGESIALATLSPSNSGSMNGVPIPLLAVAGTAQPQEFFTMLRESGVALENTAALPDHFDFDSWSPNPDKRRRLICTEKDAVKLWARFPDALAVRLVVDIAPGFFAALDAKLAALTPNLQHG